MPGRVAEVGAAFSRVTPGDLVLFKVRRGRVRYRPCRTNRPDMCLTGDDLECGMRGP
jgi:threonine dehydrogenase-like Zn-dependent dehydrogenase